MKGCSVVVSGSNSTIWPLTRVFCDESGPDAASLYVIGTLWVPHRLYMDLREVIGRLYTDPGPPDELKWNKCSKRTYLRTHSIVSCIAPFVRDGSIRYRAIVVHQQYLDHEAYSDGDPELTFYRFYWQVLFQELECRYKTLGLRERFIIHPDIRSDRQSERVATLHRCLCHAYRGQVDPDCFPNPIRKVDPLDSKSDVFMGVVDLITGAVSSQLRRNVTAAAKLDLVAHIEESFGLAQGDLSVPRQHGSGRRAAINVWNWRPQGRRGR